MAVKNENLTTLHFERSIDSDIENVFHTMIAEDTYAQWTASFAAGSHYDGSWDEGNKIKFISPNEMGEMNGMLAKVKENKSPEKLVLEYIGIVQNNEEITEGNEVERWKGGTETYILKEEGGKTLLNIDADVPTDEQGFFLEAWEKSLISLKEICEE